MKLNILLTNNSLDYRSGSELYVRDVALSLQRRGHRPAACSTRLGEVARELQDAGVEVTDDLDTLSHVPDIIHGQHHLDAMGALLRFPAAPAVHFCHGTKPWEEAPIRFPRIYRYVAVDENSARKVIEEAAADPERVHVVPNFVDLDRFAPRAPLPQRPRKALIFSNTLQADQIPLIREACRRRDLELHLLGKVSGKFCRRPEEVLGRYDIVLAKGRAALESLASGASVLLCDYSLLGPLVGTGNLERLRRFNLGLGCLDRPITVESLLAELDRYDAADAGRTARRVRLEAGLEPTVDRLLEIYRQAIDEHSCSKLDPAAELQAAGRYLEQIRPFCSPSAQDECRRLRAELEQLNSTFTIRLRNRMLKLPLLGGRLRRALQGK